MNRFLLSMSLLLVASCAAKKPAPSGQQPMGTISTLSRAKTADAKFCEHKVPEENCTRHHPELAERFKSVGDWCPEHDLPESQCLLCHPELTFEPLPAARADADIKIIAEKGADVPSLEAHLVPGKVTVFDFYADWCAPCVEIDVHMIGLLNTRSDIAYRKLDVSAWNTPLAKRYMGKVSKLPYVIVYGKDGKVVKPIVGFNLVALDAAIAEGTAR